MNPDAKPEIDISIDTSEDYETITLTFMTEEKHMSVGFALSEAQMLLIWLGEAVNAVMMHKLEIISGPNTKH